MIAVNTKSSYSIMPDAPVKQEDDQQPKREDINDKVEENSIQSCAGGLTKEQIQELQDELEKAKEENSYSTRSKCLIA